MHDRISGILNSLLNKEEQKKARDYLKTDAILFCYHHSENRLRASFRDDKRICSVEINLKNTEPHLSCSCDANSKICIHKAAALVHFAKYEPIKESEHKTSLKKPEFAGLDQKVITSLLSEMPSEYKGKLILELESDLPHAPSKWENCIFEATLEYEGRTYTGSLSNLRQIQFNDSLGGNLRISHLSPQSRQIIRFLALNAEADGFRLSMNSEMAADFLHCLSGFENFHYKKEKIIVNRTPATPLVTVMKIASTFIIQPGLETDEGILPLKETRIIIGKSGCWAGLAGKYWWIPATFDIIWLRNFLHSREFRCDEEKAAELIKEFSSHSITIARTPSMSPRHQDFEPIYFLNFTKDRSLEIQLSFDYPGSRINSGGSRLASAEGKFWKRNMEKEKAYEDEILLFGFRKAKGGSNAYQLKDSEATGLFFEIILKNWIREKRNVYLSPDCAGFAGSGNIDELSFKYNVEKEDADLISVRYSIFSLRGSVSWKSLNDAVRSSRKFIETERGLVRISDNLAKFAGAVHDIVHQDHEDPGILHLPRASFLFWAELSEKYFGETSSEFELMKSKLKDAASADSNEKEIKYFKGVLRNYQKDGVKWVLTMSESGLNVILADEMGLGKTIQALALLAELKERKNGTDLPSLVLCPSSLVENWEMEARKFLPDFKILALRGPDREKIIGEIRNSDIVVSSYSLAKRDFEIYSQHNFNYLILDEAQHIKNPSTVNAKTCKLISARHKLVLTGTPLENSAEELWSIFDFLQGGMLGSYRSFKIRYSGIRDDEGIQMELAARVSPFIMRRKKKDVAKELPEKIEQIVYCEMDDEQKKFYAELLEKGRNECSDFINGKISKFDILTSLLRLRQFCCNPALLPENFAMRIAKSAKTELMQELLLESIDSGHKLLLFSQFTSLLKIIRTWLDEQAIKYEYLDGSTIDRMDRVINFNNSPDIPVFLLSLKAGGSGLNLTSADRVIIYDPWWNPAVEMQATDRTHRIGQEKSVCSMKLVLKDSIEEKMLELQKKKQRMFTNLIDSGSTTLSHLSNEDIEFLLGR